MAHHLILVEEAHALGVGLRPPLGQQRGEVAAHGQLHQDAKVRAVDPCAVVAHDVRVLQPCERSCLHLHLRNVRLACGAKGRPLVRVLALRLHVLDDRDLAEAALAKKFAECKGGRERLGAAGRFRRVRAARACLHRPIV